VADLEDPSSELHREIFEKSRAIQLLIDPETGRIVAANPAAREFYGATGDALTSRTVADVDTLSAEQLTHAAEGAAAGRAGVFTTRRRSGSGEVRDLEVHTSAIDGAGRPLLLAVVEDVTARRAAEEALSQIDAKYRAILEGIEEGYYEVDVAGVLTFCNDALCRILGHDRQQLLGRSDRLCTDAENARKLHSHFEAVWRSGKPAGNAEWEVRRPDGSRAHLAASVSLVRDAEGRPAGFRGVVRDVTERRRAESLQSALYRIAQTTSAVDNMDELYAALHGIVGELMTARNFYIALYDEAADALSFPYFVDEVDETPPQIRPGRTLTGHVLRTGRPLLASPEVFARLHGTGEVDLVGGPSIDWLGVPLKRGDRAFGVLAVQTYSESVRFGETEMDLLTFVSQHVASAIDRKRSAEALRESEAQFRALAETVPCAIFIHQGTEFRYANAAAAEITGYSREELTAMSFADVLHPDSRGLLQARGPGEHGGAASRHEVQIVRKDGEERWLDFSFGSLRFGGHAAALGTAFDVTERRRAEQQIKNLAYNDPLTGLPNRLLFNDRLSVALAQAHRQQQGLAVLFLDLDGFKLINDSLGHARGDLLLKAVAERLLGSVREGDTVARLGGDEFTLMLPGIPRTLEAARVAEKVLDAVRRPLVLDGHEIVVTASMGISLYPDDGWDVDTLVKNADTAMYRAKEKGRDHYQLYAPAMNARAMERLALEGNLRKALALDELELHYQPLLDARTGRVRGVEALLRWRHPERGLVAAAEFMSLAELTGLTVPIAPWVLRRACGQALCWQRAGYSGLTVGVNLSARQFQQPHLVAQVAEALAATGLEPRWLELEIADTHARLNADPAIQTLRQLRDVGVRVSIDDFGVGYSSLGFLRRLPVDALKLDGSFVRDVAADADDGAIASAVIAMAHSLKLDVVAEGVETEGQRAFLAASGCDRLQGHLFSPALPPDECEAFLAGRA
jgi:diguanylate cyclase (GGDEF)-like protein/PAS domain S-box-containing protein